jgi:ubiquinone/menaquinone biosynthesis C-methylase UbiE
LKENRNRINNIPGQTRNNQRQGRNLMLRDYFNSKADIWDENIAEKDTGKLNVMAERLGLKSGSTILDVGTGTGIFLPYLLKCIGENGKIVALDLAEDMLAKAVAKNPGVNVEYLNADITDVPLEGEKFDAVVSYSSFPHFQDKPKALAEMKRVTKPGGRVYICHTSSRAHINEIHSAIPLMTGDLLPDADEMRQLLLEAGFISIVVEEGGESYFASAEKPV